MFARLLVPLLATLIGAASVQAMEVYSSLTVHAEGQYCSASGFSDQNSFPCTYFRREGDALYDPTRNTPGYTTQYAPYYDSGAATVYDPSGGVVSHASTEVDVLPGDGSLLKFGTEQWGVHGAYGRIYTDLHVMLFETLWLSVPESLDGQDVSLSVSVPYDGSYECNWVIGSYSCGSLNLRIYPDHGAAEQLGLGPLSSFSAVDEFQFGEAAKVDLNDALAVSSVIRPGFSASRLIPVVFSFEALVGNLYTSSASWDIDLLNTLYFEISLPQGVTWYTTAGLLETVRSGPGAVSSVPLPATLGLLLAGFAGLGATTARKARWVTRSMEELNYLQRLVRPSIGLLRRS
ncbi:MAG: VPLPA-CTERM sorting domain-containing protein [Burkholderiaceae bacterium]|nr:VPLPA-CTERM sorting domain-containing protein [Burkholderiaceae bacterium]